MRAWFGLALALALLLSGCAGPGAQAGQAAGLNGSEAAAGPGAGDSAPAGGQPEPVMNFTQGNISELAEPDIPANSGGNGPQGGALNGSAAQEPEPQNPAEGGLPFEGGNYSLVLDDISTVPVSGGPCGIFTIYSKGGAVEEKFLLCPGESENWQSRQGRTYRILVVQVAAGYTGTGWAEAVVFG